MHRTCHRLARAGRQLAFDDEIAQPVGGAGRQRAQIEAQQAGGAEMNRIINRLLVASEIAQAEAWVNARTGAF